MNRIFNPVLKLSGHILLKPCQDTSFQKRSKYNLLNYSQAFRDFVFLWKYWLVMKQYALMLETDTDDEFFTKTTLGEMSLTAKFEFASIEHLESLFDKNGLPVVILINDNTSWPAKDHLQRIKNNPVYSQIPIIVLGETVTKEYRDEFYRLGASTYITKPFTVSDTQKKIETFAKYWFEVAN